MEFEICFRCGKLFPSNKMKKLIKLKFDIKNKVNIKENRKYCLKCDKKIMKKYKLNDKKILKEIKQEDKKFRIENEKGNK